MASYKLEIRKQFGTFRARFGPASNPGDEVEMATLDDVVEFARKHATALDPDDDSLIFRGIAYNSVGELVAQVRDGAY